MIGCTSPEEVDLVMNSIAEDCSKHVGTQILQLEEIWVESMDIRETVKNVFVDGDVRSSKLIQRIGVDNPLIGTGWPLLENKVGRNMPDRIVMVNAIKCGSIAMRYECVRRIVMVNQRKSVDVNRSTIKRSNRPIE
eukprot:scaffold20752_cov41-Attheya_sp.AAC.1